MVVELFGSTTTAEEEEVDICKSGLKTTMLCSNSISSSELTALLNGDVRLLLLFALVGGTGPATTPRPTPLDDEATDEGDGVDVLEE